VRQRLAAFARFPSEIHGPAHWFRVRRFGALLAMDALLARSVEGKAVLELP
jgi:hypothetical protein